MIYIMRLVYIIQFTIKLYSAVFYLLGDSIMLIYFEMLLLYDRREGLIEIFYHVHQCFCCLILSHERIFCHLGNLPVG